MIFSFEGIRKTEIYGPGYHFLGYYKKLIGIYSFHDRWPNNLIASPVGIIIKNIIKL
jgi:hypothetical protein